MTVRARVTVRVGETVSGGVTVRGEGDSRGGGDSQGGGGSQSRGDGGGETQGGVTVRTGLQSGQRFNPRIFLGVNVCYALTYNSILVLFMNNLFIWKYLYLQSRRRYVKEV